MRVIAGTFRSRALIAPRGRNTRPTSDRLRETLFNVIAAQVQGSRFADLYAGSGAVGIEALSRGAADVTFSEQDPAALAAIRANLRVLGVSQNYAVEPDVATLLRNVARRPFDLVFLDPPYESADEYRRTLAALGAGGGRLLQPHSLVIAEHARRQTLEDRYGLLGRTRTLVQGDAALSFFALSQPLDPLVPLG